MTGSPLFELQHVTHVFGGRERFTALKDACLRLHEGEFVVLVGPSGCGKSTLLRILTGLLPPTEGHVLYRGQPMHGVNPHVTLVFQTFALFPWMTVQQNVEIALKARGVPPVERTARATELLDRVGLDGFESAYPRELSGGMRQKVGFARAMAVEPELLCLDEPFSSLDVLSAEALRRELLELWTSGKIPTKTILMVTHNIEEAVLLADRIVIMAKAPGRVVTELPVDLPYPRRHKTTAFLALVDEVYGLLATQAPSVRGLPAAAAGEPGYIRGLPAITIHDLAGLVEHLTEIPGHRADLFRLAEELKMDTKHFLELTDATTLLGFAAIAEGDITLTPLGETFAEASILARKEIFASRLRRLPMFQWLVHLLKASERQALTWDMVHTALELEFAPEEADRQLATLVTWGRYAELLTYDDRTGVIALEAKEV
ncbi:MAG TPA: nitrate/sulfonate/bicarbonate ABC transporter ATP-binding protein [Nitrospiraceae bacterium]|nr:nitrate/sulfonate/bicarbonate ABC transporter ATP-binding protein [Nitrospiraceae bacterium]